jgi:hypothetical protein
MPLTVVILAHVSGSLLLALINYRLQATLNTIEVVHGAKMTTPNVLRAVVESQIQIIPWTVGIFSGAAILNWIVRFFGRRTEIGSEAEPTEDRSALFLGLTLFIYIGSLFVYPMFICGCHFHLSAAIVGVPAICWGWLLFFFYRTRRERIVTYIAMALSLFSLYLAWQSNLQFEFLR